MFQSFLNHLLQLSLEASPWLVLGLIVSGLLKVWMPTALLRRWLGGTGLRPIVLAALLGTPLPLCSCSVIPAAVTLRRSGASKGATTSFLVATPENGADSIALTYALLGPFMTIVRPIAAILSAVLAGVLTMLVDKDPNDLTATKSTQAPCDTNCCNTGCAAGTAEEAPSRTSLVGKVRAAMRYAVEDLFKDIAVWLAVGLVLAAVIQTFVPPDAMTRWGSGMFAMLAMLVIGVPMYICATASTPVAAAILAAGVSPGTALVFLLAGPATNLGTVGIVRRELGTRACAAYLVGVCGGAVLSGLAVDRLALWLDYSVADTAVTDDRLIPYWLEVGCLVLLLIFAFRLIYGRLR